MNASSWILCTLTALIAASTPQRAAADDRTTHSIPTMLIGTVEPTHYPDPICSKCSILVSEDDTSAGSRADIRVGYPLDAPAFYGDIEVTVGLEDGERRVLWLSEVSLDPGDERELVAEAAADWSWSQSDFVWLRFVPR